jgi:hypothetical protein
LDITYESFFTPRLPGTVFVLSCTLWIVGRCRQY